MVGYLFDRAEVLKSLLEYFRHLSTLHILSLKQPVDKGDLYILRLKPFSINLEVGCLDQAPLQRLLTFRLHRGQLIREPLLEPAAPLQFHRFAFLPAVFLLHPPELGA